MSTHFDMLSCRMLNFLMLYMFGTSELDDNFS